MGDINRNYLYNNYERYRTKDYKIWDSLFRMDNKRLNTIANQFLISGAIALLIIIVSNFKNPSIVKVVDGARWVAGAEYDFKDNAVYTWNNVGESFEKIPDKISSILGKKKEDDTSDKPNDGTIDVSTNMAMIIPIDGVITSKYGERTSPINNKEEIHKGIDVAGEIGTPIKAAQGGEVEIVDMNNTAGRYLVIKHQDGFKTLYAHCSEILVNKGDKVKKGDYIAKVGDTGQVTSAHLHFEVTKDGELVDPASVIDINKAAR